jgi:hypothetical protein
MEYFYEYGTADTLTQDVFNFHVDFITTWYQGVLLWSPCSLCALLGTLGRRELF